MYACGSGVVMKTRTSAAVMSAVFITAMLFITFLSKEMRYFTAPKVITEIVQTAAGGFLITDSAILPNGQSVYVIEARENFWGKEYYIKLRSIRVSSEEYQLNINKEINHVTNKFIYQFMAVIQDGLYYGDVIVTGWDREIADGDRIEIFK